jgi:hypothetical protein
MCQRQMCQGPVLEPSVISDALSDEVPSADAVSPVVPSLVVSSPQAANRKVEQRRERDIQNDAVHRYVLFVQGSAPKDEVLR